MRVFNESQRFTQWWIKLINLLVLGIIGYACYKWFIVNESFGNVLSDDTIGQAITIFMLLFSVLLIYVFQLKTNIDETGIHYQFSPIHLSKKSIYWRDMKNCYVRTYNPLKEYGGWGYKFSIKNGKALNVKGEKGIQIEFKDGKKLLLGTQKEDHAQAVIARYFKTTDE